MSKISQTIEQKQKLSPKQILTENILQLNNSNLEKRILEEIEINPTLEIESDNLEENSKNEIDNEDDFNQDDINNDNFILINKNSKSEYIENLSVIKNSSLSDDILDQLYDLNTSSKDIKIAKEIIGNLDDRGYLTIEALLISDRMQITEDEVNKVIEKIKLLDPPGVASSTTQECIIAQLEVKYPDKIFCLKIIENCFELFINKKFNKIKNKLNCKDSDIYDAIELVSVLSPNPAINYNISYNEHIVPDIFIEKIGNNWEVILNEPYFTNLKINSHYRGMLNKYSKDKEVSSFIKNKINNAQWFIDAIKQRNGTIKKVVQAIIKLQKGYFDSENRKLTPMVLKNIAEIIDMDISTVSRVTNGKYVQMPWGVKELKFFFSESIQMKDGKIVSNTVLKKEIINLISKENKKTPHTDEQLRNILNKNGFLIARRTVTKYREILKEGESYVLSVNFSSDNGSLRGELRKVFRFDEVLGFNNKNQKKIERNKNRLHSTLKIYINEDFTKDTLSELKLTKGNHKVEIILNNQSVKIPGYFKVSREMLNSLKTMNGVVEVLLNKKLIDDFEYLV